jgi:hypothetical protein
MPLIRLVVFTQVWIGIRILGIRLSPVTIKHAQAGSTDLQELRFSSQPQHQADCL